MSAAVSTNISLTKRKFGLRKREEKSVSNEAKVLRQLRIKTGIVKRLSKDVVSYQAEADIQQVRLDKMTEEKRDEYDIKKMGQVVQESLMMIPHCLRRLKIANVDLTHFIDEHRDIMEGYLTKEEEGTEKEETEADRLFRAAKEQGAEAVELIEKHEKNSE